MSHDRGIQNLISILIPAVIGAGVVVVAATVWSLTRPAEFQPTTYETGKIASIDKIGVTSIPQVEGYDAPSVVSSEPVPVLLGRCSTHAEDYQAVANIWFQNVGTQERFYHSTNLDLTVTPECTEIRVAFEIPRKLITSVVFASTEPQEDESEWFISAEVKATGPGGGVARWQTETFKIINDASALEEDLPKDEA